MLINFIEKHKGTTYAPDLTQEPFSDKQKERFIGYATNAGTPGFCVGGMNIIKVANFMKLDDYNWNLVYKGLELQSKEIERQWEDYSRIERI